MILTLITLPLPIFFVSGDAGRRASILGKPDVTYLYRWAVGWDLDMEVILQVFVLYDKDAYQSCTA